LEEKEENLVKKTCRELGITQKELAGRTGFSEESISKWSNGGKIPRSAENFFKTIIELDTYKDISDLINRIKP
jgi:transcriptional regulator with XRE-family HTH domain